MALILILLIAIAAILVIAGILMIPIARRQQREIQKTGKYPEGYFLSMGIALGIPLGLPFGIALGNIAFGPGIGLAIGAGIGAVMEAKAKKQGKIRPLTEEEKKRRKTAAIVGVIALVLGILAFLGALFLA